MPVAPYLEGRPRELFDAWHETVVGRFGRSLTFREIRKGAQALSWLYVERRDRSDPARALDGQGKRAAFVVYYGALHYIVVHHVVRRTGLHRQSLRRVMDLGCGAGVSGAAWANLLPNESAVSGVDRSGWAVEEAGRTYAAFGLRHEVRRRDILEEPLPREGEGIALAWAVSELQERSRSRLLRKINEAVGAGAALMVIEPVARPAAPWWSGWAEDLAPRGVTAETVKITLRLPPWLAHMDKAAGLRHATMTVRVLHT